MEKIEFRLVCLVKKKDSFNFIPNTCNCQHFLNYCIYFVTELQLILIIEGTEGTESEGTGNKL